jgi:hypothetical protein
MSFRSEKKGDSICAKKMILNAVRKVILNVLKNWVVLRKHVRLGSSKTREKEMHNLRFIPCVQNARMVESMAL